MERDDILIRYTLSDTAEIASTGEEIGRGSYGRVFKVNYYGTLCAAKEIHSVLLESVGRQELERTKTTYLRECRQCCVLRHPNIVQFLGLYYPPHTTQSSSGTKLPVIVMELMEENLKSYVEFAEQNSTIIPYLSKFSILQDVAQGLRYLHHQNPPVVHRDLSPNNILLTAQLVAKISDLGVAKAVKLDSKHTMTKVPGTSDFMPPEALEESSKYGPPLDIFSYGGVALFVISQEWPVLLPVKHFDENLNRSVFLTEVERRQKYMDKLKENAKEIKSLIVSCLDENPKMRPPIAEVLENVKELKCKYQSKEKRNQKPHLKQQQQQQLVSDTRALHPQLQSDPLISLDPVNQKQAEKSLHDRSLVGRAVCKSVGCTSEMVEECDGYCLKCYAGYQPHTRDQVRFNPRLFATPESPIVQRVSQDLRNDYRKNFARGGTVHFEHFPSFTVRYPYIDPSHYPARFVEFVAGNLTDKYAKDALENEFRCLNWLRECTHLVPLYTTGDSNCLLHAASLAMWGFEDKEFILRNALYESLTTADRNTNVLQDRCRISTFSMLRDVHVNMSDNDWYLEWQQIVNQAKPNMSGQHQSLEESHIFVLANILRRPIIVYGIPKARSFSTGGTMQNINFHGVYLPLLWGSQLCHKPPLCLGYSMGHFTALVSSGNNRQQQLVVPLTDNIGHVLPIRFLLQAEEQNTLYLLEQYLDIIQQYSSSLGKQVPVVVITVRETPHMQHLVQAYIDMSLTMFNEQDQPYNMQSRSPVTPQSPSAVLRKPCVGCDIGMFGSVETNFLCSVCYKKQTTPKPAGFQRTNISYGMKCRSQGCMKQGLTSRDGYCLECFTKSIS